MHMNKYYLKFTHVMKVIVQITHQIKPWLSSNVFFPLAGYPIAQSLTFWMKTWMLERKDSEFIRVENRMTFYVWETCPRSVFVFIRTHCGQENKTDFGERFQTDCLSFIFVLMFSHQTYTGTIIPAVDRICVGVSPGEVCRGLVKLIYGMVCYL